jgi:metal-responsive CopG/Arc/MetJ family transcriptional regulator
VVKTIQLILDEELLAAANREAKRLHTNRSDLLRLALREHLERRRAREMEERHRRSYEKRPVKPGEFDVWDEVAVWPKD